MNHHTLRLMKRLLFLFLVGIPTANAQQNGIGQTSELLAVPTGEKFLRWYGHEGRSYFLQVSDTNNPLAQWLWAPIIESGNDEEISYEVDGTASKGFFRLKYTDQIPGPEETLETADFDHDGISNLNEITGTPPTDPLNADTDNDGLPDAWEIANSLDPNDDGSINPANGPNGDSDTDNVSNSIEFAEGTKANDANDFPIQVIQITKGADGHSNTLPYNLPQDPYVGTRRWGPWWVASGYSEQTTIAAAVTPNNLTPILNGITFPATPEAPLGQPALLVYQRNLELTSIFSSSRVTLTTAGGGISTGLTSSRVWIKATAVAFERKFHFVKVKDTSTHSFDENTNVTAFVSSEAVEVVIPPYEKLSGPVDLLHIPTPAAGSIVISYERLVLVDIVPDANMAGVIGDVVESAIKGSTVKHFVTPAKTNELNPNFVELVAAGIDASQFDQLFEWDGGEVGSAANKRKVNRNNAARTEVKIKLKQGGAVAAQMDIWVVWATCTPTKGTGMYDKNSGASRFRIYQTPSLQWRFVFKIEPDTIINAADGEVPALDGVSKRPVPGAGKTYAIDPKKGAGDNARFKWDVSRKLKETIKNPQLISKNDLAWTAPYLAGQPAETATPFNWPAGNAPDVDAEGNDDPFLIDEDDDPYHAYGVAPLAHGVGELSSNDWPTSVFVLNSCGAPGRTIVDDMDFREFCRLEIWDGKRATGRYWYRISLFETWHVGFHAKWNAATSIWDDDSSSLSNTGSGNLHP